MLSPSSADQYPQVLLFDIGGVCVVSPMQAILDYERRSGIPEGWVNTAISGSGHGGWWARLERGEVPLDAAFFRGFGADLRDARRWREYQLARRRRSGAKKEDGEGRGGRGGAREEKGEDAATTAAAAGEEELPAVPDIDAEALYWEMMRFSRTLDPHMFPALRALRRAADRSGGRLVLGALSNTSIFPPGHAYRDDTTEDGRRHKELREVFDVFVSSAHVGMRKPEEGIYRYAITRLHEYVKLKEFGMGVRPQDITFLDDIGSNLRTARKLGMNTIKVQLGRTDKAVRELEKITGLDLHSDKSRL